MMATPSDSDQSDLEQLQCENERLRRAVDELSMLNDLAAAIGASHDLDTILQTIIRRSLKATRAEQGVITLFREEEKTPLKTLVRTATHSRSTSDLRPNESLVGWIQLHQQPLLVNDPSSDERFKDASWSEGVHSLLCVPLMVRGELMGLLTVYNSRSADGFSTDDQRLLSIIAAQSAQVIENARLFEEEKELLRVNEELRLAYEIQTRLLPEQPPTLPGYELAGTSVPAHQVGGDYFDFIPLNDDRLAFCVGDVSGKGLPAALLMASLQATLRGQAFRSPSADDCLSQTNTLLHQRMRRRTFVTLFYGLLDTRRHRLHYANAGHNRPFLRTADGHIRCLEEGGLVLGAVSNASYQEATLSFAPGDLLLVYSDGITEAMNTARESFGEDRLKALLASLEEATPQETIDRVLDAAQGHAGTSEQHDDMTLLAIRRTR